MGELRTAEIIAVGSELLTPHRADTNSLFLTTRLNELGIDVRAKAIVGDHRSDLAALLTQALLRADIVVTTGGLGPTSDDVTRDAVAGVVGRALVEDATVLAAIRDRFAGRGLRMPDINRRQAQIIEGAFLVENPRGTAPGQWVEAGEKVVLMLPGPPKELQPMVDALARSRLLQRSGGRRLRRRVIKITGRTESHVDEVAHPIYATFEQRPVPIQTTILASPGQIELRLAAQGNDVDAMDRALDAAVTELADRLAPAVFSVDGRGLEEVVGALLRDRGETIAVAESCTGGLILARLTDVPGSSAWVRGGVMAYANDVKVEQLGVPPDLMAAHGAVSEPVAEAMADGVRARLHAHVGVSVTGIAGPTGGSEAKPVGTVVIAVSGASPSVRTFRFPGDRQTVRRHATQAALDMVRRSYLPL
jgi:competence/damage-inducible protein CinA-like protein